MAESDAAPVAVIVGPGSKHDRDGSAGDLPPTARWGLGGALCLRFAAGGFHVALLCRREAVAGAVCDAVRAGGGAATFVACDVGDDASVAAAFAAVRRLGPIRVLVFNVAPPFPPGRTFANLPAPHDVDPSYLSAGFNVGVTGCLRCVRECAPAMLEQGRGTILLSGATMSVRGGASFACMSPVKFALRSLGQSMFQAYAAQGVHVAHVIIDGVIDSPNTHEWGAEGKMQLMDPEHLADAYFALHTQPSSVWAYEIQLSTSRTSGVGMRM